MRKKKSLGIGQSLGTKEILTELAFTRIILILTSIFFVSRTADIIGGLGRVIVRAFHITVTYKIDVVINLVRQLSNLVFTSVSAFNVLIYIKLDKNLKEAINKFKVALRPKHKTNIQTQPHK